jgi:hypothetical protein
VNVFSRDAFVAMADIGEQVGAIDERGSKIIRNLFRFKALQADLPVGRAGTTRSRRPGFKRRHAAA